MKEKDVQFALIFRQIKTSSKLYYCGGQVA